MSIFEEQLKGGAGSGNFGHAGRPGERGGSSSEEGGGTRSESKSIERAEQDVLKESKETGNEAVRVLNGKGKTILSGEGHGAFGVKLGVKEGTLPAGAIIVHSHPFGAPLSAEDLLAANHHGASIVAVSNDGGRFEAKWIGDEKLSDDLSYTGKFSVIMNQSNQATNELLYHGRYEEGWKLPGAKIPREEHIRNLILHEAGYINYHYKIGEDLARTISGIPRDQLTKAVQEQAKGLRASVDEKLKSYKKSLKAADSTKKERFDEFLSRAEDEGFLDGDQIDELRDRFEQGEINDDDIPLALDDAIDDGLEETDVEESRSRLGVAILGAALVARAVTRDRMQTEFEDKVMDLATNEPSIPQWQTQFGDEIARHMLDQATLGRGGEEADESAYSASLSEVGADIQEQQAYLSRFADERASRALTGDELTDMYVAARSALYSGAGRAEWFKGELEKAGDGDVVYYRSFDDAVRCDPCEEADDNSPYLPDDPDLPYPGDVCEGRGNCRCELEIVNDPEMYRLLNGEEKSFYKGGAGSGNFGHGGRPGERGGSSSESGGELPMKPTKGVLELHDELIKFHGAYLDTLAPNEKTALRDYMRRPDAILKATREGSDNPKDERSARTLESTIERAEAPTTFTIYRGDGRLPNDFEQAKALVGTTLENNGVVSTSINPHAAVQFSRGAGIIEAQVKAGDKGLYAGAMWRSQKADAQRRKGNLGEAEWLPPFGTAFKIIGVSTARDGFNRERTVYHTQLIYKSTKSLQLITDLKGGSGSGNFGHAGRPGERGGSSSSGGDEVLPAKFADLHGHSVTAVIRRMGKEGYTFTETRNYLSKVGLHDVNDTTIRIQLNAGKSGQRGEPANLDQHTLDEISKVARGERSEEQQLEVVTQKVESTQDNQLPKNDTKETDEAVRRADARLDRGMEKGIKAFLKKEGNTPEARAKAENMRRAYQMSLDRMSPGMRIAIARGLKETEFLGSTKEVNEAWHTAVGQKPKEGEFAAAGFYTSSTKTMTVDEIQYGMYEHQREYGAVSTMAHIYTHEMGHAIDYAFARQINGWQKMSSQVSWQKAFDQEINLPHNPLSAYAKTNVREGFAEYTRLVVHNPGVAREKFPMAWKYFEKKGLTKKEY